jgi:phosphoribosyl-ATP pyrophosphohydrolase
MIIPSIDLSRGQTVQLIGGRDLAVEAGDPVPIAERFRLAGEIAVVDLDAAMGNGMNVGLMKKLAGLAPCRVGGGIRDAESAVGWLDAGATRVVLGTAAVPEVLKRLPRERVVAALDARHGEVVVQGWTHGTGRSVLDRMRELSGLVGGFLVTFVEREGRMQGLDLSEVKRLVQAAGDARLTVAGGVRGAEDIAALDAMGVDAQVGMALYTNKLDLADAISAPLKSDRPDGLWATVVCDEQGVALGLAWSDRESLRQAVSRKRGIYRSRSRGLWVKGETSGATQELLRVDLDCDRDALRFTVRQNGSGFCHLNRKTCWGDSRGLDALLNRLRARMQSPPPGSYTARLLDDPGLLEAKLVEEATELARAGTPDSVSWEAADLLYFTLVAMARAGVGLEKVSSQLDRRGLRITRRGGDAKEKPS